MIITFNEELLRVKCEDVLPEEVGSLIETLENELNEANRLGKNGIGLAASQIGIAKNIAIIRLDRGINLNLINCKLDKGYDPLLFQEEGCLSFPGRVENTMRFQEVHIVSNLVEPYRFTATGFLAVACQHELDHLNSVLFMDRAAPKPTQLVRKMKIRPNDPCPCASGKKYKKCCETKGTYER
jgi:peptide deformylase